MNRRAEILQELARFEKPQEPLLRELGSFGFNWTEEPLLVLKKDHLLSVIDRFLRGEIRSAQLQQWAEAFEVREDVGFDEREEEQIKDVFFRLATPEINEPLTHQTVRRMKDELTSNRG
jgi:ribosomal protein L15